MLTTLVVLPLACCALGFWMVRRATIPAVIGAAVGFSVTLAVVGSAEGGAAAFLPAVGLVAGAWLGTVPD